MKLNSILANLPSTKAVVAAAVALGIAAAAFAGSPANATACYAAWNSSTAYSTNAEVSLNGVNYTAAFWSQNSNPSTNNGPSGSGEPWVSDGACGLTTCSAVPSAPAVPTATSNGSGTNVSWAAVTPPANCAITGYEVYVNGTALTSTTSTSYNDQYLTVGTTYKFTVAAVDAFGTGSQSPALSVTPTVPTCLAVLPAVTGLTATNLTTTSVTINWNAVAPTSACSVVEYLVTYARGSQGVSGTSATFSALSPSSTYQFIVYAIDQYGESVASTGLIVNTPAANCSAVAAAPTGVTATNLTSTGVTINWNAVSAPANCAISEYLVTFPRGSVGVPTGTSTTFSSLTENSTYTFTVYAIDQFGESAGSAEVTVTTPSNSLCSGVAAWSGSSVSYVVGNLVTYSGSEYKCIQSNTSQPSWNPVAVPALWSLVGSC